MNLRSEGDAGQDLYSEDDSRFPIANGPDPRRKPRLTTKVSSDLDNMSRAARNYLNGNTKEDLVMPFQHSQEIFGIGGDESTLATIQKYVHRQKSRIQNNSSRKLTPFAQLKSEELVVSDNKDVKVIDAKSKKGQRLLEMKQAYGLRDIPKNSDSQSHWQRAKERIGEQAKQRSRRQQNLERAKDILSGKISIVWIFAIAAQVEQEVRERIYKVYNVLLDDSSIAPFVESADELQPFLMIPNCYFKIVADLANIEGALKYRINVKVVEFYIYNDQAEMGMSKALLYKRESKKIKGIFSSLEKIVERAEEEVEDSMQLFRINNSLEKRMVQSKFPSFLLLTGKDKTEATLYRANLYGSIKLKSVERESALKDFLQLVNQKYGSNPKERQNIVEYSKMVHSPQPKTVGPASSVLKFYVRESFYYQILNSMLRTLKTTDQFKPCVLPFNENYHAIKFYYKQFLQESFGKIPAMTLYRGAKLRKKDFDSLKPGTFIEMYGFMSTSKSMKRAEMFTDNEGYIIVVHVRERVMSAKILAYDHGFVDINRNKLASGSYEQEEQVLFNALNIFKVGKVEELGGYILIHLQYGAIFDILDKPRSACTADEKDTLINYQYCIRMLADIEDQGDVLLLASEHEQAKDYYRGCLERDADSSQHYLKLANVQKETGQIAEAERNALKSLEILERNMDLHDRETCLKVFSIHLKNAEITLAKEDFLQADEQLSKAIELLDDTHLFEKGKKLRQRGEIRFKKGEILNAEDDLQESVATFEAVLKQAEARRWTIRKRYFCSLLSLFCSSMTKEELDRNRDSELTQVQQLQSNVQQIRQELEDELIKVNKSQQEVSLYVQDKEKYEQCVKKARSYFLSLQQRSSNDPREKAKLKVMQATVQDYLELAESQKLLVDAIHLIESDTPFDPVVGEYSVVLGKLQKKSLDKFLNPGHQLRPGHVQPYSQQQRNRVYERCKKNFQKAINILIYNNTPLQSPDVLCLKNQLGDLQFGEAHYENCQAVVTDIRKATRGVEHSEIAKASLLLAKIAFSRGELKHAFEILKQADDMLQRALIKDRNSAQYIRVYQHSDCYLEIGFVRSRVYNKQMSHDLALQHLDIVQQALVSKMQGYESHSLLASILEERAQINANQGDSSFNRYFTKAAALRQKQMGRYNIPNGICHCNHAKYLLASGDIKAAEQALEAAVEIFSCLSPENPISWIIYFANGTYNERRQQYHQANSLLQSSLKLATAKFDSSHITIQKLRLKVAKNLVRLGLPDEACQQLRQLESDLDQGLRESSLKSPLSDEIDDQKITLKKLLYCEMKDSVSLSKTKGLDFSSEVRKYDQKYEQLRTTFNLENDDIKE